MPVGKIDVSRRQMAVVRCLGIAAMLLNAACQDPQVPVPTRSVSSNTGLPRQRAFKTYDEVLVDVGNRAPGFAGFWAAGDGSLTVATTNESTPEAVVQALGVVASGTSLRAASTALAAGRYNVVPARYNFRQLYAWKEAIKSLRPRGMFSIDADEVGNTVRVGVDQAIGSEAVGAAIASLKMPDGAATIVLSERPRHEQDLSDHVRPTRGGLKVYRDGGYCSMGPVLNTSAGLGFVISSHCTTSFASYDGTEFGQPDLSSGNSIGVELYDPAPLTGIDCHTSGGCRYSDAAFILLSDTSYGAADRIARPEDYNSTTIDGVHPSFTVAGYSTDYPSAYSTVHKVGYATGWTYGMVMYTCVDLTDWDGAVDLNCQYLASYDSASGDSGSPVFTWDGYSSSVTVVGIHEGVALGYKVFSSWMYISLELSSYWP